MVYLCPRDILLSTIVPIPLKNQCNSNNYRPIYLFILENIFNIIVLDAQYDILCCCLPTPITLAGGVSDVPACGHQPASPSI